jgi:polyhydroxyalkanoate synthesis repressor PhaR
VTSEPAHDVVVIRRYPNRRLYDTDASRYVTLEDIAVLIEAGREVRVEDARSGEDVTRALLAQIVAQMIERDGGELFAPPVLHRLIRARRLAAKPGTHTAFTWMLDQLLRAHSPGAAPPPAPPAPDLAARVAALEDKVERLWRERGGGER